MPRTIRIRTCLVALLAVTAILTSPASAETKPPETTAPSIAGRVTAAGAPVKQATVRLFAEPGKKPAKPAAAPVPPVVVKTGEDGSFTAKGLSAGTYTVRVEASGFAPFTVKEIPSGASVRVGLKPGGALTGRVYDMASEKPLPRARVVVCDPDARGFGEEACRKVATGEDGSFRVTDLTPGVVRVEARADRHAKRRLESVRIPPVRPDEPAPEVTIVLGPGGRVAGQVVDPAGKAIPDVTIAPQSAEGQLMTRIRAASGGVESDSVKTDAAGRFALEGLPAGSRYTVSASREGYCSAKAGPYAIEAGTDRSDVEIRVQPAAILKARVVDAAGKPVSDVDVDLEPAERGGMLGRIRFGGTGEDVEKGSNGQVTVRNLDAGTYTVHVRPTDFAEIEREGVRLRGGETTDLGTLVAKEGRGISGRITGKGGEPVADAQVRAMWGEMGKFSSREAKSKADGSYRVVGMEESAHVIVSKEGYSGGDRDDVGIGETAVDFVLERAGSVTGRVVLAGGEAAGAFRVVPHTEAKEADQGRMFRFMMGAPKPEQLFTDPSGSFRVDDISPGSYTIEAIAAGKVPAKKTGVKIGSDEVVDVGTLVLEDGKTLRGRVLDAKDDTPVAGAVVRATVPQGMRFDLSRVTNDAGTMTGLDGAFTIEGLDAGARNVSAEHPEFATAEARVEIPADGEPEEAVVRLLHGGALTGTVRDAQKQPVAGATILLSGRMFSFDTKTAETGPDGRYSFERLSPGDYNAMRPPDSGGRVMLKFGAKNVTIAEGKTTVLDFDEAAKISLSGRVLRGGNPVPNAMLLFLGGGGSAFQSTQSDDAGGYSIGLDRAGTYQVMVQNGSTAKFQMGGGVSIEVPDQPEAKIDVVLAAGGISGRVTDDQGNPVSGARVSADRDGAGPTDLSGQTSGSSDASGAYSLTGITPGTYRVTASASGYQVGQQYPVVLSDASPGGTVDFKLEKGATLRGRLVDPQGKGISGALVFAAAAGSTSTGAMPASTDVNGDFVATAPSSGPMDVTAVAPGWAPTRAAGVTASSGSEEPAIVLRASLGGRIRVHVLAADGKAAPGIQTALKSTSAYPGSEFAGFMNRPQPTGADGFANLSLLAPGSYEVSIPDRTGVVPLQVSVAEGGETEISFRLP